jgi:hypothetical protein
MTRTASPTRGRRASLFGHLEVILLVAELLLQAAYHASPQVPPPRPMPPPGGVHVVHVYPDSLFQLSWR